MGSASPVDCCEPKATEPQFASIVPSRIHAIAVVEEQYEAIKETVSSTSFLSEVDYYIAKFKESQTFRCQLLQIYPTFEDLLDVIIYEVGPQWIVPAQSKTYSLNLSRYNNITGEAFPIEFGLVNSQAGNADVIFSRGNLRKVSLLLLEQNFKAYKEEEYLQLLINSLRDWHQLEDVVWVLDAQKSFADMRRHLLYHWNRCIGLINSYLSVNDALSWYKSRFLYNFALQILASDPLPVLEDIYCLDNWVYQAEAALLSPGQGITFFGFAQLTPYVEENVDYDEDAVRFSPPKGEEEIPRITIKFIVVPLKETANKFRCNEYLYYLPMTTFLIENIEQKYGKLFVYLKEEASQKLTNYLSRKTRANMLEGRVAKDAQRNMLNELNALRDNTVQTIQRHQARGKMEQFCQDYYKRYVKNRVVRLSDESMPKLSKQQLEICEDEIKVGMDEQPTLEEAESEPRWVPVTPQETARLAKNLQQYIKSLNFEKLQSQIDNADTFINITTLNISQCWLEKLECLHCFPNLLELFAYSNFIKKIEGLERNENLRLLSLARNQIDVLENIDHLVHLRELYLTKNKLELPSAQYLSRLNLPKLRLLTISFKSQADECFDALLHRPPPRLKHLVINEGDQLIQRTKNTLRRRLKGVTIQYIHS